MASQKQYKTMAPLIILICLVFFNFEAALATSLKIKLLKNPYKEDGETYEIREIFRNLTTNKVLISRFPDLSYQKLFLLDENGVVYSEKGALPTGRITIDDKVSIPTDLTFLPPPIIMEPNGRFKIESMKNYFIVSMINDPDKDDVMFSNLYGFYLNKDFKICNGKDYSVADLPMAVQGTLEKAIAKYLGQYGRGLNRSLEQYFSSPSKECNIKDGKKNKKEE